MLKYNVTYLDRRNNVRNHYILAKNERDALVDSWLENRHIQEILEVKVVALAPDFVAA